MLTANQITVLVIFVATYVSVIAAYRWKLPIIIVSCAVLLAWPGLLTAKAALLAVNWNVIMLYFGMLFMTEALVICRAPAVLAERLLAHKTTAGGAMLIICLVSGFVSAFVENVAVVLLVAPIALAVTKRLGISPVPVLIGVSISSNLQGAATLIGDPPSMLLAGALNMDFNDFFWYHGRPSIFFAVELGAIVSATVLWLIFRKHSTSAPEPEKEKMQGWMPVVLIVVLVVALALASVLLPEWDHSAGWITLGLGLAAALWWWKRRGTREFLREMGKLDWWTGLFLVGIFIVVGSVVENGLVDRFVQMLARFSGDNLFLAYSVLVWGSVALSAFVDNVPFVAAMLPVCAGMAQHLNVPVQLLAFGMMIGASVGGNITPIGASANIVSVGIARREGYNVSFWQFVRIGLPFTIAGTAAVYAFLWFVWR